MERSLEYQKLITEATKGLYESIYEVDVTRDRADSEETRHYFERLGISATRLSARPAAYRGHAAPGGGPPGLSGHLFSGQGSAGLPRGRAQPAL